MWMWTPFSCSGCQPTLLTAPLAFSCAFFLGLYGPPYPGARIQDGRCMPQSLYGTESRPIVQSIRGSTVSAMDAFQTASRVFHVALANALGRPVTASTANMFAMFCDGWWNPQHLNGLPECGRLRRSP